MSKYFFEFKDKVVEENDFIEHNFVSIDIPETTGGIARMILNKFSAHAARVWRISKGEVFLVSGIEPLSRSEHIEILKKNAVPWVSGS